nr:GDP-mannose 4,6-dehydratase [Oceanotoga teriensis]
MKKFENDKIFFETSKYIIITKGVIFGSEIDYLINYLQEKTGDKKINEDLIKYVKDRLGHDRRYGIDPTKIKEELNWEPTIMFEQGIKMTIDWYLNNKEWMESVISGEYLDFYEKNYK